MYIVEVSADMLGPPKSGDIVVSEMSWCGVTTHIWDLWISGYWALGIGNTLLWNTVCWYVEYMWSAYTILRWV